MPHTPHKHEDTCPMGYYTDYLVEAAPNVLWYNVQDVGSYSGSIYGVGQYKGKALIYEYWYGSCGGCGAWGEGGEPTNEAEVLSNSHLFESISEAEEYISAIEGYEPPDTKKMINAVKEILK